MIQRMFATCCVLLSALACSPQSPGSSPNESARIAVSLSLPKSTFTVGESVPANIEISNTGDVPVLIGNRILMSTTTYPSHIEFEIKNERGQVIPATPLAIDSFGQIVEPSPAVALLKWLQLLSPGYSLSKVFLLDAGQFKALSKPGAYMLSASYSSNGLSYPPVLALIGVKEADVESIPFAVWTGKIRTNELSFKIVPARNKVVRHRKSFPFLK